MFGNTLNIKNISQNSTTHTITKTKLDLACMCEKMALHGEKGWQRIKNMLRAT